MTAVLRLLLLAAGLAGFLQFAAPAQAQVIVYRLEFKHKGGFNVDYFTGGFLAAPMLGGVGSFMLTAIEDGRRVLDTSPGSGSYYLARSGDRRFNVVSATIGTGADSSANGSYVAHGETNRLLNITTPKGIFRIKVASVLRGESIAADDEDGAIKFDGSTGTANFSELTIHLEERLTREFNEKGFTLEEATTRLTRMLRWRGFAPPGAGDGGSGGGDGGTGSIGTGS